MEKSLVSIIIPVYNTEKYLVRCLDSVCNQTYKNLEVIMVVDDTSTDNCPSICASYANVDERFFVLTDLRQGCGAARDKGLDFAHGEWICFLDSDDFFHPRFVEIMLKVAVENDCLTVQCKYQEVYNHYIEMKEIQCLNFKLLDWQNYIIYLFRHAKEGHSPFGVWLNIYHYSLFHEVRFNYIHAGEDSYVSPRLIYAASSRKIAVLDLVLYYYMVRPDSLLHSTFNIKWIDHWYAKECAANFWKEHRERELYDYFYTIYFNTLVIDYLRFCVYLPNEKEQYEILRLKIEENYEEAKRRGEDILLIHPGASLAWKRLQEPRTKCIQYGYGSYGELVHPFLKDCGFDIEEIWDENADGNKQIDGVPIRKPHDMYDKQIRMLITVKDELTNIEICLKMKHYGIKEFVPYRILGHALRYGMYHKYLPLLLESK